MAVEAILFGQSLAAAEQVPGDGGEGTVQRGFRQQFLGRGIDLVAVRVEQAVAALGLADVAGHQRQVGGQFRGQLQQRGGIALAQFQLQFADFLLVVAGDHLAQVERRLHDYPGLAAAPGDLGALADEVGAEDRLELLLVEILEGRRPALVVEFLQVELVLFQVPVPLVAFGQPGHALPAAFQRLDVLLAVAAHAQRDLARASSRPGVS